MKNPLRPLYDWTISWAVTPHAERALGGIAFAESSFFPIPPDVLLIPMGVAAPRRVFRYAAVTTVASVLGGALGYAIGGWLNDEGWRDLLREICWNCGIEVLELPDGVRRRETGKECFWFNYSTEEHAVQGHGLAPISVTRTEL